MNSSLLQALGPEYHNIRYYDNHDDTPIHLLRLKDIIYKGINIAKKADDEFVCPDIDKETSNEHFKLNDENIVGLYPYKGICVGRCFTDSDINRIEIQYIRKCHNYFMYMHDIIQDPLEDILTLIQNHREENSDIGVIDYVSHMLSDYMNYVSKIFKLMYNKIPNIHENIKLDLCKKITYYDFTTINIDSLTCNFNIYSIISELEFMSNKGETIGINELRKVIIKTVNTCIYILVHAKRVDFIHNILNIAYDKPFMNDIVITV